MAARAHHRHRVARLAVACTIAAAPLAVAAQPASALPCVQVTVDYPFVFVQVCPPV
jgi:hypothetical protein